MRLARLLLRIASLGALVCVPALASAASDTAQSVESWMEAGLGYELPLDLGVEVGAQIKLDDNLARVRSILPQVEITYRVTKWLKVSGSYRFIYERNKAGDFEPGHRLSLGGQASLEVGDLAFKHRLRFQDEWDWSRDGDLKNRPTLRNMVGATYDLTDWLRPGISAEHFLAMEKLDSEPTRKWRLTAGPRLVFAVFEVDLFYRLEIQRADTRTELTHVIGLGVLAEPWDD